MERKWPCGFAAAALSFALPAAAHVTFYEREGFRGQAFSADRTIANLDGVGFNDRARSLAVNQGRWEVCTKAYFGGECFVLRPGYYDSLFFLGLRERISSIRPVDPTVRYDNEVSASYVAPAFRDRPNRRERLFDAPVTSVRAIHGEPGARCWARRGPYGERSDAPLAGGPVADAKPGGSLSPREAGSYARNLPRCDPATNGPPVYWDVTYKFKGVEHYAQMTAPPRETILVNENGFPRG